MPDKCVQCGKELGNTHPGGRLLCPTHGENRRWPECGKSSAPRPEAQGHWRYCWHLAKLLDTSHAGRRGYPTEMVLVAPETCVSCPILAKDELIAALVQAVKAAKGYCSGANRMDCAVCTIALRNGCEFLSALAAAEKAKPAAVQPGACESTDAERSTDEVLPRDQGAGGL